MLTFMYLYTYTMVTFTNRTRAAHCTSLPPGDIIPYSLDKDKCRSQHHSPEDSLLPHYRQHILGQEHRIPIKLSENLLFLAFSPLLLRMRNQKSKGCLQKGSVWLTLAEQIFLPETLNHCLPYYKLLLNCCVDTEHEKMFHMAPCTEITQEPINSVHTTGNVHAFVLW